MFGSQGVLFVRPVSAQLTHDVDYFSKMDPLIVLTHNGNRQKSNVCYNGGKHPFWQDQFDFNVSTQDMIFAEIFDHNTFESNQPVATAEIQVSQVINMGGSSDTCIPLFWKGKPAGNLKLNVQFTPAGGQMGMGGQFGMGYQQQTTYVQPQQTYIQPQQTYVQPQTTYVQPQTTYVQPQPTYVQPQTTYVQPQTTYIQPQPTYVQPQTTYIQPQQTYIQPQPTYVQPQTTYVQQGYVQGGYPQQQTVYTQQVQQPPVVIEEIIYEQPRHHHHHHNNNFW